VLEAGGFPPLLTNPSAASEISAMNQPVVSPAPAAAALPPLRSLVKDLDGCLWRVMSYFPQYNGELVTHVTVRPPDGGVEHRESLLDVTAVPVDGPCGDGWISGAGS
jgi:hypothetical protein